MIGTVLLCQVMAPWMCMDVPNFYKHLRVTRIEDEPADLAADYPAHVVIHTQYGDREHLRITINSDTQELIGWHDSGSHYGGSGDIGILLIGLPGILLTLPLLILVWLLHRAIKFFSGKDTQRLILWKRLKGQLPTEVAEELNAALAGW